jgi:6-phospho-beta-glucosidase
MHPNEKGLQFYDDVFDELHKARIEPIVTISHYEMPFALTQKYAGWQDRRLIDLYVNYATTLFNRYRDKVKYWLTFNEINSGMLPFGAYLSLGMILSEEENTNAIRMQALHHQLVASAKAVKIGHEINPAFKIGCMICYIDMQPLTCHPLDVLTTQQTDQRINMICGDVQVRGAYPSFAQKYFEENNINLLTQPEDEKTLQEGRVDFYSFSYYMSNCVSREPEKEKTSGNVMGGIKNPYLEATDWGWQIDPVGLRWTLNHLYDRYEIPLMLVENGMGALDKIDENGNINDGYRIEYLSKHIEQMKLAIQDGVDLIGYTLWSPIDIVSASTGEMKKRYGLIHVDKYDDGTGTFKRRKKQSFKWYKKVIATNGEDLSNIA